MKGLRIGTVGAISFGVEFFPIEWVGISVNWQARYYSFAASQHSDSFNQFDGPNYDEFLSDEQKRKKQEIVEKSKEAFSIPVNNILSLGVHFTF